jgi:hypothetical protein
MILYVRPAIPWFVNEVAGMSRGEFRGVTSASVVACAEFDGRESFPEASVACTEKK